MTQGTIHAIYLASRAGAPLLPAEQVRALKGLGLEGDRYALGQGSFSRWPGMGRAVSFVEQEVIEAVLREHGLDLAEGRSRRNVVTTGVALLGLVGRRFRVGGALFRGDRPCEPCGYLERRVGPGLVAVLRGRGGLRADVLEEGTFGLGDGIEIEGDVRSWFGVGRLS